MRRRDGQTCFEVLWLAVAAIAGILTAMKLSRSFGMFGAAGGFVAGFSGVMFGLRAITWIWEWYIPAMPKCRCRANDYQGIRNADGLVVWECAVCRRRYVSTHRMIEELLPNGDQITYASHKPFLRWKIQ